MRGRTPSGPKYVEQMSGSELAKRRLQVILETMTGRCRVQEACAKLGISEPRFHQLRLQMLEAAMQSMEPGRPGRRRRQVKFSAEQLQQLQEQLGLPGGALRAMVPRRRRVTPAPASGADAAVVERLPRLARRATRRRLAQEPDGPGQAISYTLGNWDALVRHIELGFLAIDNNVAEREMKKIAIGRKNFLFVGSDKGGRTAAVLFTFTSTCQRHGVDPFAYLRDVLDRLAVGDLSRDELANLLPDRWTAPPEPPAAPSR